MSVPTKTALGQEELRKRTHRLSQRHRTILLLVDGRRPLAEVLSLAQQAGASTSHFEDLLRLGLVDLPERPEPAAPISPPAERAGEVAEVTAVAFTVTEPLLASPLAVPEEETWPETMPAATELAGVVPTPVPALDEPRGAPLLSLQEVEPPPVVEPAQEATQEAAQEAAAPVEPATEEPQAPVQEPALPTRASVEPALPPVPDVPQQLPAATATTPRNVESPQPSAALPPAKVTHSPPTQPLASPVAPVSPPRVDLAPRARADVAPPVVGEVARRAPPPLSSSLPLVDLPDEINPLAARSSHPPAVGARVDVPARLDLPTLGEQTAAPPPSPGTDSLPAVAAGSPDLLQQVRELLIDALRLDQPLFSARMFVRVRHAQTAAELIDLVWEIQDGLVRARHAHRELKSVQQARELLGLGNTLVSEETRPQPLDD